MDERSQKVITLKYWHELVNRDIAPILGVSNAQISRIERAALAKLKEEMETDKLIHS
ncbi:RNA polymerase sigma 28 subunit [Bacillus phage QCM8]|nr:RNA polymerase sigma 28 subunit [Bacillus phage QCM8]